MPKPRSASGWRPIASICSHLAEGRRADIILVVGVVAAERLVHLTDARRLLRAAPRKAVAAA